MRISLITGRQLWIGDEYCQDCGRALERCICRNTPEIVPYIPEAVFEYIRIQLNKDSLIVHKKTKK